VARSRTSFAPGHERGGRPKGAVNKLTLPTREAIEYAAQRLGGAERLAAWARENAQHETVFWSRIYVRLLPVNLSGDLACRPAMPSIDGARERLRMLVERAITERHEEGEGAAPGNGHAGTDA
jgi:hypothetical protein